MRKFWLLDQHGSEGATALVETDGSMHIVAVSRFGPDVTELDQQQEIFDRVIGRVAPTLKPLVDAASIDEEGVPAHDDLQVGDHAHGPGSAGAGRGSQSGGARNKGRVTGGPSRKRSRGDR